jgi:hypothetical protein
MTESNPRNAGRKALPASQKKKMISLKLHPEVLAILDENSEPRSVQIERLVREKTKPLT